MTENEIEIGLTSPNLEIRRSFAENLKILLNVKQIERGLIDRNPIIRYIFARRLINIGGLLSSHIERGLKDENNSVRALFVLNNDKFISQKYIESFLKDESIEFKIALSLNKHIILTKDQIDKETHSPFKKVREAFIFKIKNSDIIDKIFDRFSSMTKVKLTRLNVFGFTRYQIERGLIDSHPGVREAFYHHCLFHNNISYGSLNRGVIDSSYTVRVLFAKHKNMIYTDKQIETFLTDNNEYVRRLFTDNVLKRFRYSEKRALLTQKQIERGLKDPSPLIRCHFYSANIDLTDKQTAEGLADSSDCVRAAVTHRFDFSPTPEQIKCCLNDIYPPVRCDIISNIDIWLNNEQIETVLTDENEAVRLTFALFRHNIRLTERQINRGLTDDSIDVRSAFVRRTDCELNTKQIEQILKDDETVILSLLQCTDITLTFRQIGFLLANKGFRVSNALRKRDEYILYNK